MTVEHSFPRWYKIGAVECRDPSLIKALVNTALALTSGRYDSLDSPRGTTYQVPTGKTLYITKLLASSRTASGGSVNLTVGYGDTHVENSAAAPTNAIVVFEGPITQRPDFYFDLVVFIPIPAGKYPFAMITGDVWNTQAEGIEV